VGKKSVLENLQTMGSLAGRCCQLEKAFHKCDIPALKGSRNEDGPSAQEEKCHLFELYDDVERAFYKPLAVVHK